jgi:hypothetical protein
VFSVQINSNNFVLSKESVREAAPEFNGCPLDCRILGFFYLYNKPELKMSNLDHDAAKSAVTAAYFGVFLVKEN